MEERAGAFTVRIQHHVHEFADWKTAFDSDPGRRQEAGVHRYRRRAS